MSILLKGQEIKKLRVGSTPVLRAMKGSAQIWPKVIPVDPRLIIKVATRGTEYVYDRDVYFPLSGSGMTATWGDGAVEPFSGQGVYRYRSHGTYTASFVGNIVAFANNASLQSFWYNSVQEIISFGLQGTTSFQSLFYNLPINIPLPPSIPPGITNMRSMFQNALVFNRPIINGWDVSKVTTMAYMFNMPLYSYPGFNQPLDNWDTGNVTDMQAMFQDCISFNQPLGSWNVSKVNNFSNMFLRVTLSPANYDHLLNGWSQQNVITNRTFHAGNSKYTPAGAAARARLISTFGWTILDGGPV